RGRELLPLELGGESGAHDHGERAARGRALEAAPGRRGTRGDRSGSRGRAGGAMNLRRSLEAVGKALRGIALAGALAFAVTPDPALADTGRPAAAAASTGAATGAHAAVVAEVGPVGMTVADMDRSL